VAACAGCGDPQAPKFKDIRISYKTITGDWVQVADVSNGTVEGSPVSIEGIITDNTAVVDPSLSLIAQRNDLEEWRQDPFQGQCRGEPDSYYECDLTCEKLAGEGAYVCDPALPAEALIRGDRYVVTLTTDQGDFELEVRVREALRFDASFTDPEEAYRVLKLVNVAGDPNPFLWGLRYRSRKDAQGEWVNEEPLRYGDSLKIIQGGDTWFQLLVNETVELQGTTYTLTGAPTVMWQSLYKWNQYFPLDLDPKTGGFTQTFQFFDPREGLEIEDPTYGSLYTFSLYAHDVPNQKNEEIREHQEAYPMRFVPPAEGVPPPTVVVTELGESGTPIDETSTSSNVFTGNVSSVAGEVKSLQFVLSNADGDRTRIHYLDTESISLLGDFAVGIELVSDWGTGTGEDGETDGSVLNRLEVVAYDMRGQFTTNEYEFPFLPPTTSSPPSLSFLELFPVLDGNGNGLLPASESVCLRGIASDNTGQPEASSQLCGCSPKEALEAFNDARCVCGVETPWAMDASGRFPADPWEIIRMEPTAVDPVKDVALLFAREPSSEDPRLFSALGVNMEPDETASAYTLTVTSAVSTGPINKQVAPQNATLLEPTQDLTVQVSILPNILPVDRLVALYNGRRPEDVEGISAPVLTFGEGGDYILEWAFLAGQIGQGTRICVGGESVAGHQSLQLLEFTEVREGWMVGVSGINDETLCAP